MCLLLSPCTVLSQTCVVAVGEALALFCPCRLLRGGCGVFGCPAWSTLTVCSLRGGHLATRRETPLQGSHTDISSPGASARITHGGHFRCAAHNGGAVHDSAHTHTHLDVLDVRVQVPTERRQAASLCAVLRFSFSPASGCKAMKTVSFCALSLSCSLVHRAAAWAVRPSQPHAHRHHTRHRCPSRHSPAVWAGGRRASHHSCGTRTTAPSVALEAAGTSTSSKEEAVGYEVDESGRCTDVQALPPLKNRYYALRHGQSVANMYVVTV